MACCSVLVTALLLLLGHFGYDHANKWLYPETVTSEQDNVIIKIEPEEFIRSGPVRGSVMVHGTSSFQDETVFKTRLVELLQRQEKSLHQLKVHHIVVSQPMTMTMPKLVDTRKYIANSHAKWVPHQTEFDFTTGFDHSHGISRKAVQDALQRIANSQRMWDEPNQNFARSLAPVDMTAECETMCQDFMFAQCTNCKGEPTGAWGEPAGYSCTCQMEKMQFYTDILSNPIWAIVMCITGCICASQIQQQQRIDQIPNGGDFDGICNCFQECNSCMMGWCCPAVRMANTYYVASVGEYFPMLFISATLYGVPMIGFVLVFIMVCVQRRKIRAKANMRPDGCMDCLCSCFCTECVICQEARLVDSGAKGGGGGMGGGAPAVIGMPVQVNQ